MSSVIGSLFTGPFQSKETLYGRKPVPLQKPPFDINQIQADTVAGNAAILPGTEKLSTDANAAQIRTLESAIPGSTAIRDAGSANMLSMLQGNIPQDVQDSISRGSAFKGMSGGFGGSSANRNLTARDLGRTSLELSQGATNMLPSWMAGIVNSFTAPNYSPVSSFLSPQQRLEQERASQELDLQLQGYNTQLAAAPKPGDAVQGQMLSSL